MPRLFAIALLFLPAVVTSGCPVYSSGCQEDSENGDYDGDGGGDCAPGYVCRDNECIAAKVKAPGRCHESSECQLGKICDRFNRCVDGVNGAAGEGGVPGAEGVGGQE